MLKKLIYKILSVLISIGITVPLIFFILVYNGFFGEIPTIDELSNINNLEASTVYDVNDKVIGKYYIQDRTPISFEQVPEHLIKALVITEDKRFYKHGGVDFRSLVRVAIKSILLQQSSSGGGSTITLQLAKNLYPRESHKFLYYPINKTREAIVAFRIEELYTKDEILELYLNTVSFGEDIYGIEAAAQRYFNKHARDLTIEQSATLVGMLKATTYYSPVRNPEISLARRNLVLGLIGDAGLINQEEIELLKKKELGTDYQPRSEQAGEYLMASLRKKIGIFLDSYNKENETTVNLLKDGLRIYTTIDKQMQVYAEEAMHEHMISLQKIFDKHWYNLNLWNKHSKLLDREIKKNQNGRSPAQMQERREMLVYGQNKPERKLMSPIDSLKYYLQQLQAGFVAMDPYTGALKSWVGGINYGYFPYDHVETRAKRQVGSTFKPIVYAAALQNGISPCEYYKAKQLTYDVKEGNWSPANDDASYEGKYSMEGALEGSVNTVAVKILEDVGIETAIDLAKNLGISSTLPEVPSLVLGTASISLIEMVTAYSSFVNGGYRINPYMIDRIEDNQGNILYQRADLKKERVLAERTSRIMVHMLEGVVEGGTARSIRTRFDLRNRIGGKTGTTQNNADGWFIAVTPKLVAGAWAGGIYPEISFTDTRLGQGATMALPVFARFYQKLTQDANFNSISGAEFKSLKEEWAKELNCDPFKEDFKFFEWLFGPGDKKDTQPVPGEKKEGLFKKLGDIFKRKKN